MIAGSAERHSGAEGFSLSTIEEHELTVDLPHILYKGDTFGRRWLNYFFHTKKVNIGFPEQKQLFGQPK